MKLPSLKFSLPFIFLCWCIAGVLTHGSIILAYPAMWAVVGIFFYGLHVMTKAPSSADAHGAAVSLADGSSQQAASAEESPTDHKISAPV